MQNLVYLQRSLPWTATVPSENGDRAIGLPITFHRSFKFTKEFREVIQEFNSEVEGLKIVEIPRKNYHSSNPFENGILFKSSVGCFWTVGKSPGFAGYLKINPQASDIKHGWQFTSVTNECDTSNWSKVY